MRLQDATVSPSVKEGGGRRRGAKERKGKERKGARLLGVSQAQQHTQVNEVLMIQATNAI
jgi:hypothetical protein